VMTAPIDMLISTGIGITIVTIHMLILLSSTCIDVATRNHFN
jgi:hypothetical protein